MAVRMADQKKSNQKHLNQRYLDRKRTNHKHLNFGAFLLDPFLRLVYLAKVGRIETGFFSAFLSLADLFHFLSHRGTTPRHL